MANNALNLTSLDYDDIKASLTNYLAQQPEFAAYDFQQGGLAAIVKVLAYASWNDAWLLNMVAAESFLDSAQLMASVASHAKELGYVPRSAASARARVRVTWRGDSPVYYLQKGQSFSGLVRGAGAVDFSVPETQAVTGTAGAFSVELDVMEGPYVADAWVLSGAAQRYPLTSPSPDTGSLAVSVYEGGAATATAYAQATTLLGLDGSSRAWFLQASPQGGYEVCLGDGASGYLPAVGSRVVAEYRVTKGPDGNGCQRLTAAFNPYPGDATDVETVVLSASAGGSPPETIDSVRFRAPRHFRVQERAVNADDYGVLLTERFPEVRAAVAVGGEELDPPLFGRVAVSVDLSDADFVSDSRRSAYETFLRARAGLTVRPIVRDPDRAWVSLAVRAWYDPGLDVASPGAVRSAVTGAAQGWADANLAGFGASVRLSRLQAAIDDSAPSVVSNECTYSVYRELLPSRGEPSRLRAAMGFRLEQTPTDPSSAAMRLVESYTVWTQGFSVGGVAAFAADDGLGRMRLVRGGRYGSVVGSVDYAAGVIDFPSLLVGDYSGTGLRVYATPASPEYLAAPAGTVLELGDDLTVTVESV